MSWIMRELNELTKHLLSIGYTKESPPPDYRKWDDYCGGWTYSYKQESNIVVEAPCGIISNSRYLGHCSQVGYCGIDWCLENDNALMRCPYNKKGCELNDPIVRDSEWAGSCWCKVKIAHRAFDYELSAEKIEARNREAYEDKVKRFAESQPWFCRSHLLYDQYNDKFQLEFNPMNCLGKWCPYCEMRGRELTTEKGNVFYDVKETRVIDRGDLLGEEVNVTLTKGERLFEKGENLDKCKAIAARPDLVTDKAIQRGRRSTDLFFAEYHGLNYKIEILNVRAEKRESRDLEKDLADISEGIAVVHASDLLMQKKQAKMTRAAKARSKRTEKLIKEFETAGSLEQMETRSRHRLEKALEKDEISWSELNARLIAVEDQKLKKAKQISIFDILEESKNDE